MAEHFSERDRLLLEQVYRHGLSVAEVARLTGRPRRTLSRHVRQLLERVRDPLFRFVAGREELLPREVRSTARLVVLQGRSLREAGRATGLSLYRVRQHMQTVRELARIIG
ncbi:MAG: hypothetical protein ACOCTI_03625 [Phycisphaeraceae bacterium]